MHALIWLFSRAFTKFGIAIAASKPMIATTIMISTKVNPDLRNVLTFIGLAFLTGGVNASEGRFILVLHNVHSLPFTDRSSLYSNAGASNPCLETHLSQHLAIPLLPLSLNDLSLLSGS